MAATAYAGDWAMAGMLHGVEPIGTGPITRAKGTSPLVAVELRASASNPSTREVALLPNAWVAYGLKTTRGYGDDAAFVKDANAALAPRGAYSVQRHSIAASSAVVAAGRLFSDVTLKPNETIATAIIVRVRTVNTTRSRCRS